MLDRLKRQYKRYSLIIVMLLALAVLLVPHVIRYSHFDNFMVGGMPYYHARIAQRLSHGYSGYDQLSYSGSAYIFDAYDVALAIIGQFIGVLTASNVLPFALGLCSVVLLFLLLGRLKLSSGMRLLTMLLWILSPVFIYTFTVSNPFALVIFLNLAGFYFFTSKDRKAVFSILFFAFIPLFGIINTLITAFLAVIYTLKERKKTRVLIMVLVLLFSVGFVYNFLFYSAYGLPGRFIPVKENLIQNSLVELGAVLGFNTFVLLLSIVGMLSNWRKKSRFVWLYILMAALILSFIFIDPQFKSLLSILVSFFAAFGLATLADMRWELKLIRNLTIAMLLFSIMFSTYAYIGRLSFMEPGLDTIGSLTWLRSNSVHEGVVISDYKNGFWIEYFARRPVVMDSLTRYRPEPRQRYNDTITLFRTRDMDTASGILDRYDVRYIFVDAKTRALMLGENNILGLEFLLENSNSFKMIKNTNDVEIWEYNQSKVPG